MISFGPTERIKVGDLRVGDFLDLVPNQQGVRGVRVESGVAAVEERIGTWGVGRPRHRTPAESRLLRFLDARLVPLDLPSEFVVHARRRLEES